MEIKKVYKVRKGLFSLKNDALRHRMKEFGSRFDEADFEAIQEVYVLFSDGKYFELRETKCS